MTLNVMLRRVLIVVVLMTIGLPNVSSQLSRLRASGTKVIKASNQEIFLRGVSLGAWLALHKGNSVFEQHVDQTVEVQNLRAGIYAVIVNGNGYGKVKEVVAHYNTIYLQVMHFKK
jgi:hypothetical protein